MGKLVWKLNAERDGVPGSLLDSYHEEHSAVGKRLLNNTSSGLKSATAGNLLLKKLRDAVLSLAGQSSHVQDAAMGFVSENDITYRNSSL